MTKAELQAALDVAQAQVLQMSNEIRHLRDIVRVYERTMGIVENMARRSTSYWSGS